MIFITISKRGRCGLTLLAFITHKVAVRTTVELSSELILLIT
jgi:hypothetical protein